MGDFTAPGCLARSLAAAAAAAAGEDAQDWFVLELSGGSGVAVGITTALQFLPMLLLSPVGGLVADRFSKRSVLKVTQLWLAGCAALLGILAVTGVAQTWQV
ncbi:MAG TPA: MFS transporter, partial [Reyranella sp.]|nr:MFS transporter [Reyranella sp.]